MPFINAFFSYLLLLAVSAVLMAAGIALGIFLRKRKDKRKKRERGTES